MSLRSCQTAANEQDLPALPDLERAVADFEERFHQAGEVSVVQVRANKSGKKSKSHKGGCRARPHIDSTREDSSGSSMRMSSAAFESGEELAGKKNKSAAQK